MLIYTSVNEMIVCSATAGGMPASTVSADDLSMNEGVEKGYEHRKGKGFFTPKAETGYPHVL